MDNYDDDDKVLRAREASKLTTLSRTTIWRLQRAHGFPRSMRLSERRVGYRRGDIIDWLNGRP